MATTLSLADFRTQYPQFQNQSDAYVSFYLSFAAEFVDVTTWGDRASFGIGLLAAHHLSLAPSARDSRLDISKQTGVTTVYKQLYDELVIQVAGGARAAMYSSEMAKIRNKIRSGTRS